jgi:hypothetical protein
MDVVDNLETSAFVGEEVIDFWGAETSEARSSIEGLPMALGERFYHVPLIEFAEHVGPGQHLVSSGGIRGHGMICS